MFTIEIFFILIVLFLFFGLPFLIKGVDYPAELEFERVSRKKLPSWAADFFEKQKIEHQKINFRPGPFFTVKTINYDNISQFFINDDQTIIGTTSILKQPDSELVKEYAEYASTFDEGNLLVTRSVTSFDMFYAPPDYTIITYPGFRYPLPLVQRHRHLRQKLADKSLHIARIDMNDDQLLTFQQTIQQKILNHQLNRRLLRKDDESQRLKGTFRLASSIISHVLNPINIDFSLSRLIGVIGWALVNCIFSISIIPSYFPIVETSSLVLNSLYASVFCLTGFLTGILFLRKFFPWTLVTGSLILLILLTFLPELEHLGPDLFILYIVSSWLGQTQKTYKMKIQGVYTFLYPTAALLLLLFMTIVYGS